MNIVNVGYDSANYYVLGNGHVRLLVDAGWPGTLPRLLAGLKRTDIDLSEIGYLLATHYHPDHAGLAQELKDHGLKLILPDVQVSGMYLLRTFMNPSVPFVGIRPDDNLPLKLEDSRAFLAGIGLAGQIVATPGHTDDSVSLVLDDGSAFTGDLHPPAMVDLSVQEIVTRSWEAVRSLGASMIYPGHGPVRPILDILNH